VEGGKKTNEEKENVKTDGRIKGKERLVVFYTGGGDRTLTIRLTSNGRFCCVQGDITRNGRRKGKINESRGRFKQHVGGRKSKTQGKEGEALKERMVRR